MILLSVAETFDKMVSDCKEFHSEKLDIVDCLEKAKEAYCEKSMPLLEFNKLLRSFADKSAISVRSPEMELNPKIPDNNIVIRLKPVVKQNICVPDYLYYVMQYLWMQGKFDEINHGSVQQFLRSTDIKNIICQDSEGIQHGLGDLAEIFSNKKVFEPDDIILQRVGTKKTIGKPFFVKGD